MLLVFTDTYSQVSVDEYSYLEDGISEERRFVYLLTTTDKDANRYEDWQIIRYECLLFFAFLKIVGFIPRFSKVLEIA